MAWLESHQELRNHPKIMRAARALGISRAAMIGHMHCLWWWALDYAQDGNLADFTADDIAQAAEWEGDPAAFVNALAESAKIGPKAGLLEYQDDALCIHDWWDYAGKLIGKRQSDAQRKRDERKRDNVKTAQDLPQASSGHPTDIRGTSQVQYSTVPNPTVQDNDDLAPEAETVVTPEVRAISNAYDACGIMLNKTHQDEHLRTIKRYGLAAWQLGFATAMSKGKHNMPAYVARCAESAHIQETHGNGHTPPVDNEMDWTVDPQMANYRSQHAAN